MADPDSRAGTVYHDPLLRAWVDRLHAPHDGALARAFGAPEALGLPAIQVGPNEGRFLHLLLKIIGARKVVEIGALAGYSALWIARALPADGHLWTLEISSKRVTASREVLAEAGLTGRTTVLEGRALDLLPELGKQGPFDAVFLDADKENYLRYGRWAAANLMAGGLLLADNAFFFGRLLEDSPEAASVRGFHEEAAAAFETACLPTPDGLLVGLRRPL